MTVIDDVKERLDIVQVVSSYINLQKAGRNFKASCPFHTEKQPSFYIFPERQSWHCFGACNTGGDIFSFVMKKENVDFAEALRILAEKAGVPLVPKGVKQETEGRERERLHQLNEAVAQYYHHLLLTTPAAATARAYIEKRGLTADTVKSFQLGYSPDGWEILKQYLMEKGYIEKELLAAGLLVARETGGSYDRFRNRLMFPIRDFQGRVTGLGARALDDSLPKYINSPQTAVFDKSSTLYGIDRAKSAIRERGLAVIVEGYMDVIMAHQYGETNVVASMGIALTDRQIAILKRLTRNLALALDADAAGEEATLRVAAEGAMATDVTPVPTWSGMVRYENTLDAEVRVVVLPSGRDPDEVIMEDRGKWRELVAKAPPILDYAIDAVAARTDLSKAREKSAAADRLLPIISDVKDPVRQAHYMQKLSRVLQTDEKALWGALRRLQPVRYRPLDHSASVVSASSLPSHDPIEEYCLTLLVHYPDLKPYTEELLPEYFESSESRELYLRWKDTADPVEVGEGLDAYLKEYYDNLAGKPPPALLGEKENERRQSLSSCVLRLREKWLRGLERKRRELLVQEAETGGHKAALAKHEEQGIETGTQIKGVYEQRRQQRYARRKLS
ncbi:MAG: DNA primase [Chloroflexota bacterium]